MKVYINDKQLNKVVQQRDLFAPKESGSVVLEQHKNGYMATYVHTPGHQYPPVLIVNGLYDEYVRQLLTKSKNVAVSWWLIGSYAYYMRDVTLISDEFFDYLTLFIRENFDEIVHVNKDLITPDRLDCGSAYDLRIYPTRVMVCAESLMDKLAAA